MRTPVALVGLVAAALLTGACSSGAGSTGSTAPGGAAVTASTSPAGATTSPTTTSATGGLGSRPAAEILTATRKAMASARTVHVTGAATEKGERTRIDLRLKRGAGAVGSIGVAKGSLNLIRLGTVAYVKGDSRFYTATAGKQAAALLVGKWIKVSSGSSGFASFLEFTDLSTFGDQVTRPSGTVTKGAVRTVGGRRGIELTDGDSVLVVALEGPAYPLFIGPSAGSAREGFTFSDYGSAVALTAPPASQVVDVPIP